MHATRPSAPRTYNQAHARRIRSPGRRRISIYWTWSYPWESNRDTSHLDDRFSTMTEVRRVAWPAYEGPEWTHDSFLQGIAGTLELFHRSTLDFQRVAEGATGHPVAVYQRVDQAGFQHPIDERLLEDTDTLLVFGLDHVPSEQHVAPQEIEAIREWLGREDSCLLVAPHHDVGASDDPQLRQVEYRHHRDALVPRRQRFGTSTRDIMKGLGIPVMNRWGLRPALVPGTKDIAPLVARRDVDSLGLLAGVDTFNFHPHLPQYDVTGGGIEVLARQPIDLERPHPFTDAGNREINVLLWMPPAGGRAGHVLLADSTHFTTLFGGTASLARFWHNLASMK
jgi:hypothetical protein